VRSHVGDNEVDGRIVLGGISQQDAICDPLRRIREHIGHWDARCYALISSEQILFERVGRSRERRQPTDSVNLGLTGLAARRLSAIESSDCSVRELMSSNKVPLNVESGATWCRMIRLPAYRDQHLRASGWAANQVSGVRYRPQRHCLLFAASRLCILRFALWLPGGP
jgi:hypothetical protein